MGPKHIARTPAAADRRPVVAAPAARSAVASQPLSPARALQQRLGNQGMQALLARTAAQPAAASAPASVAAPDKAKAPVPTKDQAAAPKEKGAAAPSPTATATGPAPKPAAAASKAKAVDAAAPVHTAGATEPAPQEAARPSPQEAIAPAVAAVQQRAAGARRHSPPTAPVASALAAAINPQTEQTRAAATATVATLDTTEAEQVKRDQFKTKLKTAIEAATLKPKTEAEAENMMKSGGAQASNVLRGQLASERDAAAGPLKAAAATEVPASAQPAPPKAELQPEPAGPPPAPVSAAPVVPAPLPAQRLDYSVDRAPSERLMADNNISQEQLRKGNEPAFGPALDARSTAEKHEASAEARYRQSEVKVQEQTQNAAQAELAKNLSGMQGAREQHIGQVVGHQLGTRSKNQLERQRITDHIHGIKDRTRTEVTQILAPMEDEASSTFEQGLKQAEDAYRNTFDEATGGIGTWLTTWGSDWEKLIETSLVKARAAYMQQVNLAIDKVADLVDARLKAAKQRVADGRKEVETYVKGLDASVKSFGEEALQAVSADFDAMGADIDQRRDSLIDKLAQQYKDSHERMSAMENQLREENKSLWQRVHDATVGLVKQIMAFKDMLLGVLGRAGAVINDIFADPIGFLGNLVAGVMRGLKSFVTNIGSHLKKGLMDWLFGALAGAGLQLPDTFDLKGILSIVLQILGLTYANFRARAVKIVGEPIVAALEQAADVFKVFITEGVGGLWRFIKEKVADLKSMVLDAIFDFIKEKVIVAGITWIIGLLNPASAFFKACKAIYDIVMFFVNRGAQILALVNAIIDSIAAIVKGNLAGAAAWIENTLAKAVPLAIGFLAGLLGLGDPSKPVRTTIEKAQSPVNKAIDWVINQAVKLVKAAGKLITGTFGKRNKAQTEPTKVRSEDARDVAYDVLHQRLGNMASVADAEKIIHQTAAELKPIGVKRIELGPEDKDEQHPILVEASPLSRVSRLVARRVSVAVEVKILMSKELVIAEMLQKPLRTWLGTFSESLNFLRHPGLGKEGHAATLPPVSQPIRTPAKVGEQPSAGVILEPLKGGKQLEILAWNTGVKIGGNDAKGKYQSNVSHAEHQFIEWFMSRPVSWGKRVESIEITVQSSSKRVTKICELCSIDISEINKKYPQIKVIPRFIMAGQVDPRDEKMEVKD